jgi:hypothetical protein
MNWFILFSPFLNWPVKQKLHEHLFLSSYSKDSIFYICSVVNTREAELISWVNLLHLVESPQDLKIVAPIACLAPNMKDVETTKDKFS